MKRVSLDLELKATASETLHVRKFSLLIIIGNLFKFQVSSSAISNFLCSRTVRGGSGHSSLRQHGKKRT